VEEEGSQVRKSEQATTRLTSKCGVLAVKWYSVYICVKHNQCRYHIILCIELFVLERESFIICFSSEHDSILSAYP
jgi:hypothetical protein